MKKKDIWGGLLAALVTTQVAAQEVDEIVVSATGIPTPAHEIGASVDVITAADLEAQQITYLQDALKLKGINVPQNGGPGGLSNVFMRGLPGKYTDLVVDGISMFDPGNNQVFWNDVIADGIGQVEILRGSQGVLYGSNTIAGVISQFTDVGGLNEQKARVEIGENSSSRAVLTGKGEGQNVEYGYGVSRYQTDGFSARIVPNGTQALEDDGYQNTTMNAKIRRQIGDHLSVEAVLRHAEGELDTDGFSTDEADKYEHFERTTARLAATMRLSAWTHTLGVTSYDGDIARYVQSALTDTIDAERLTADYKTVFAANDATHFIFGAESDQSDDGSNEIDVIGVYMLVQQSFGDAVKATLAARQDDHDLFGKHDTYRATATYSPHKNLRFRLAHGTGFRAPSLSELYALSAFCPNGVCGNPDLQPETSVSSEIGVDLLIGGQVDVNVTAYQAEIEDIIGYDPNTFVNLQIQGTSEVSGLELDVSADLSDRLSVEFSSTYIDSDKPSGDGSGFEREVRVPRLQNTVALNFGVSERMQIGGSIKDVKGVVDVGSVKLDDYTLLNITAAYQISDAVKAYARVENAEDDDYETVQGFGTPGRAAYVGITTKF